jgi:hypothetical protein
MHSGDPGAEGGAEPPPAQRHNGASQSYDKPWVAFVTLRDAALHYAAADLPVLPLAPRSKRPLLRGGFQSATTDTATLRFWWRKTPDANIGLVTGERSGLFALDIDGVTGENSLATLKQTFGPLPRTLINLTGRGRQFLFAMPRRDLRCRVGVLPGLDVRAEGGYVTAPPSIHPLTGEPYRWADADPTIAKAAPAPEWLIEQITSQKVVSSVAAPMPPGGKRIVRYVQGTLDAEARRIAAAVPGNQEWTLNAAAFSLGGLVAESDLSMDEVVSTLVQAGLRMVNDPGRRPWSRQEIEAKVRRGLSDGAARAPRRLPSPVSAAPTAGQTGGAVAGD